MARIFKMEAPTRSLRSTQSLARLAELNNFTVTQMSEHKLTFMVTESHAGESLPAAVERVTKVLSKWDRTRITKAS